MSARKKQGIRPGDLVRIVDPRSVLRVGYPRSVADYLPEVRQEMETQVLNLIRAASRKPLAYQKPDLFEDLNPTPARDPRAEKILRDLAHTRAASDHFGGRHRSLHLSEPYPQLAGRARRVLEVRFVQTGTYYPPSGGYESEPGGLENRVTRRLATLDRTSIHSDSDPYLVPEFPADHLHLLLPCQTCDKKVDPALSDRDDRLRTVHPFSSAFDGYDGRDRCYYCGTPFEDA